MPDSTRAELRRLAEKASKGPWAADTDPVEQRLHAIRGRYEYEPREFASVWIARELSAIDAAFIAAANPSAVLALLDRADELERERQDLAMLVRMLANKLKDPEAAKPALHYLQRHGLQGSPLRED